MSGSHCDFLLWLCYSCGLVLWVLCSMCYVINCILRVRFVFWSVVVHACVYVVCMCCLIYVSFSEVKKNNLMSTIKQMAVWVPHQSQCPQAREVHWVWWHSRPWYSGFPGSVGRASKGTRSAAFHAGLEPLQVECILVSDLDSTRNINGLWICCLHVCVAVLCFVCVQMWILYYYIHKIQYNLYILKYPED